MTTEPTPMPSVNTARALAAYRERVGVLLNDVILRDIYITELTDTVRQLTEENQQLRDTQGVPQPG